MNNETVQLILKVISKIIKTIQKEIDPKEEKSCNG